MLRLAIFAIAVLGVRCAPLDEPKSWHNDTATNTSSSTTEEEGWMTIFAPMTEKTQLSIDIPGEPTIYSTAVTQVTQLSLEGSTPEETGKPSQDDATARPGDSSPVTNAGSSWTTYVTFAPSPHLEQSGTYVVAPDTDTIDASRAPKIPHTMVTRTELDGQTKPTEQSATPGQGDNGDSETAGPDATSKPPTQEVTGIAIVVPVETGKSEGESSSDSQYQQSNYDQSGSKPTGNPERPASRTLLLGTTPIVAGGSPVTVDSTTFSLASTGSAVVVNGATISFTTNEDGQAIPLGTAIQGSSEGSTDAAAAQILGGLSVAPEAATTSGANPQQTQSGRSSNTTTGNGSSQETSTGNGESGSNTGDSEATSTDSSPAAQSDNVGVANPLSWPLTAAVCAIGFFVAAL